MKRNSFAFLSVFLTLIFAANVFAQNNSTDNKDIAFNRPRLSQKKENAVVNVFDLERLAFDLVNKQRALLGLSELAWSDDAAKVARLHSNNMADSKYFSHKGLDGLMVDGRADSLGVKKWQAIGENIAFNRGYDNPTEFAVECWMESDAHRKNLLNSRWKETGIGVAVAADGSYYFTQVFLLRK